MIKYESLETKEINRIDLANLNVDKKEKKFIPHGAIAFFLLLMVLCLVIWFGIYFLMLERT